MSSIRVLFRLPYLLLVVTVGTLITPFVQDNTMRREGLSARTTARWHRWIARSLGVRTSMHGSPSEQASLYVSNHISWFDICALGSVLPVRFLSKAEVARWPLVGWLATRAGTLYIERGAHGSREAIASMANALTSDQNVCLFAEGTTTDGSLRKFHGRLIQSAIDAEVMAQPVALFYPPGSEHDEARAHPSIVYIDDMSLAGSMIRMMKSPDLYAEIHFLDPVPTAGKTRDQIAKECEQAIRARIDQRLDAMRSAD